MEVRRADAGAEVMDTDAGGLGRQDVEDCPLRVHADHREQPAEERESPGDDEIQRREEHIQRLNTHGMQRKEDGE